MIGPRYAPQGELTYIDLQSKVNKELTAPASEHNQTLRLCLGMWKNPHPDRKVASIDYIFANTDAAPFCVAMTVEEATGPSGAEDALDSPPQ